jgi:hypothetical protein
MLPSPEPERSGAARALYDYATLGRQETSESASKRPIPVPGNRNSEAADEVRDAVLNIVDARLANAGCRWIETRDRRTLRRALLDPLGTLEGDW